jgi:hypothetical protein
MRFSIFTIIVPFDTISEADIVGIRNGRSVRGKVQKIKIVIYLLSVLLVGIAITTMFIGRNVRRKRRNEAVQESDVNKTTRRHALCGMAYAVIGLLAAVAVEILLTVKYGLHRPHLPGFMWHLLGGVVPFALLLPICVFWITGKHKTLKRWHKRLTYPLIGVTIIMAATGDWFVYHL